MLQFEVAVCVAVLQCAATIAPAHYEGGVLLCSVLL